MYIFLADLTAAVHLAILGFVVIGELVIVVGGLCGWGWVRNFWFRLAHLVTILIVVVEALCAYPCPLTTWEGQLRVLGGGVASDQTFVERIVHPILFREGLLFNDPALQASYYIFGALVLATFILVPPFGRGGGSKNNAPASDVASPRETPAPTT
jgi:hypothetical protein